MSSSKRHE